MENNQEQDDLGYALSVIRNTSPEALWLVCHAAVGCDSAEELIAQLLLASHRCERFSVSTKEMAQLVDRCLCSTELCAALLVLAGAYAQQDARARAATRREVMQ